MQLHIMMTARGFMLVLLPLLFAALTAVRCCVLPAEVEDPWTPHFGSPTRRTRREVTLSERRACSGGARQLQGRVDTRKRVDDLISQITAKGLDAYIIPSGDEHQSEYVAPADERRAFITGFEGSAGTAVVLSNGRRALWTDGRYFLSADDAMDCQWLLMKMKQEGVPTMMEWLKEELSPGARVGVDTSLVGADTYNKFAQELNESRITLEGVQENLVDTVWGEERPPRAKEPVYVLGTEFAGMKWEEKVMAVRAAMRQEGVDLLVVTALDEVAWLLNLRGNDIPYFPVFRSYLMMDHADVTLFIDSDRITPVVDFHLHVKQCLQDICFYVTAHENLVPRLQSMAKRTDVNKVLLPKKYAYAGGVSYAVYEAVPEKKRYSAVSPVLKMKGRKNAVEAAGMRNAHLKDAVALIDFLAFMEKEINAGKSWNEMTAAARLTEFRAEQDHFVGPSFNTISAYGANGAIIHYRPTPATAVNITMESLYLLDSGGQYKDGTTDVTRTLHYGTPTQLQKETYTRVLLGAIDLARLVFPKGTGDASVDILARRHLYRVGLDYRHGTGHGIGMFLSIHESPTQVRIYSDENHEFELSQFFSDEPGYYQDGEFGIRLETILTVIPTQTKYTFDKDYYAFEAVTLVPYEPKLINLEMFNGAQCKYLNEYHARVRSIVGSELENQGRHDGLHYMQQRTLPLSCSSSGLASGAYAAPAVAATSVPGLSKPVRSGAAAAGVAAASTLAMFCSVVVIVCSLVGMNGWLSIQKSSQRRL